MVKLRDSKSDAGASGDGERLASLDAVRGLFLVVLVGNGFGLRDPQMLSQERWGWLTNQFAHRDWAGCTLWDLLQPALLFLVGIGMPYSYANRLAKGQNWIRQFAHAVKRSALLIVLGIYLASYQEGRLVLDLRGDLQQIGLAYLLAFLVLPAGMAVQAVTIGFLLVGYTSAHVIYAFASKHELWDRTTHLGIELDRWMQPWMRAGHLESASYSTFNAVSAASVVLLGVLIGGLIRSGLTSGAKVAIMAVCSLLAILFGWVLSGGNGWIDFNWIVVIPMVKRMMTWTFTFNAIGWTLLLFTYFYLLIDGFFLRSWAMPLAVFGRNSLFVFVGFTLFRGWAARSALLVLPGSSAALETLRPLFVELAVLAIFWLICCWLYYRRIFFKV